MSSSPNPSPVPFAVETLVAGFEPPPRPSGPRDAAAMDAADVAARHWRSPESGKLKPGSATHAQALRSMFRETFNPYRPAVIAWPKLSDEERDRITALPIWDIAVQTEGRARMFMAAYAGTLQDPAMRDALALNAWEESRHKEVLSRMVEAYGIPLVAEPPYPAPADPEWAYMVTGYSECVDSFFAFGLFALAQRSGLFPPELVETFEPVMQEECRHILLFANWAAWHRRRLSPLARLWFELKVARVYLFLMWERIGLARSLDGEGDKTKSDSHFTVTGAKSVTEQEFNVRELLELCLAENDRRFAGYDPRLLRPTTMPTLVRLALAVMPKPKARRHTQSPQAARAS
jgi:hypothetical protein